MKTYSPKASELTRKWYVVDAKDKVLGRLASEIALRLRGKHKAEFLARRVQRRGLHPRGDVHVVGADVLLQGGPEPRTLGAGHRDEE